MMACILGGFGLGLYLDRLLGTPFPILLILFLLAGIGCGFWRAYVAIMRVASRAATRKDHDSHDAGNGVSRGV